MTSGVCLGLADGQTHVGDPPLARRQALTGPAIHNRSRAGPHGKPATGLGLAGTEPLAPGAGQIGRPFAEGRLP